MALYILDIPKVNLIRILKVFRKKKQKRDEKSLLNHCGLGVCSRTA